MDVNQYKRNPAAVVAAIREMPNGSLVCMKDCVIHVPESFRAKQLLSMGTETISIGFFVIVLSTGEYGVYTIPSMIRLNPAETVTRTIDDTSYYEFSFKAGQVMVKSIELVKDNIMLYYLTEEILARGRIPWFYDYEDLGDFFNNMLKYTGTSLVSTPSTGEMMVASIARNVKNRAEPIRNSITKLGEDLRSKIAWVPLRNVEDGAQDTTSKIAGNYMAEGLDAAIQNPSTKVNRIESMLRA
jgi:hypothetical protein